MRNLSGLGTRRTLQSLFQRTRPDVMMIGLRSIGGGQGGVEAHVGNLAQEISRLGVDTNVVVRKPYSSVDLPIMTNSFKVTSLPSFQGPSTEALFHSILAVLYAAVIRPRILHIHAIGPSLVTPLAKLLGLSVVATHHGEDYKREKWGRLAKFILRIGEMSAAYTANARIAVSRSLAAELTTKYQKAFTYIPNGVESGRWVPTSRALDQFGLEPGKYILNVSRLVPEKRHMDLIDAFRELGRPDLRLVLVGAADHKSSYSQRVSEAAMATPGVVMTGFLNGLPLAEIFSHAGVFVLPSSHEGLPIALLEAMSYCRPVVASDIDANRNVGLPSHCYVETGSPSAIARRLKQVFANDIEGAPYVDWTYLLKDYEWGSIAKQTVAIYNSVDPLIGMTEAGSSGMALERS